MERNGIGTDRVRVAPDGTVALSCRHSKPDWVARRPADGIRGDFPGTCIRWGEEMFEVVSVQPVGQGVRYLLAPWRDDQTIRTICDYDRTSEARREEERTAAARREAAAKSFTIGALFAGLLPGDVQTELESELGVVAYRATFLSAIPLLLVGGYCLIGFMSSSLGGNALGMPVWVYLMGIYFWLESMVRIGVSLSQSRPVGSLPLVLGWEILATLRGRRAIRPEPLKIEPDPSATARDAFIQREPFLSFLSPAEQLALERAYEFDWRQRGRTSAIFVLIVAVLFLSVFFLRGIERVGDVIGLLLVAYLLVEQIMRLQRISAGRPAGSILGVFVRAFSRKALDL